MFERADRRDAKPSRKILYRGKPLNVTDPDPLAIARVLRKNSKHKKRIARLEAAEAKVAKG
ncbi:hypothetical protein ACVW1A_006815 [Bradyrhizobium sp. LB1.3]